MRGCILQHQEHAIPSGFDNVDTRSRLTPPTGQSRKVRVKDGWAVARCSPRRDRVTRRRLRGGRKQCLLREDPSSWRQPCWALSAPFPPGRADSYLSAAGTERAAATAGSFRVSPVGRAADGLRSHDGGARGAAAVRGALPGAARGAAIGAVGGAIGGNAGGMRRSAPGPGLYSGRCGVTARSGRRSKWRVRRWTTSIGRSERACQGAVTRSCRSYRRSETP